MTPAAIIEQVKADGVALTLSEVGILRANGYGGAVNRWLPTIRRQKAETLSPLRAGRQGQMLAQYQDAVAAKPFSSPVRHPSTQLTGEQKSTLCAWLARIGEIDQAVLEEVIHQCQQDMGARDYFAGRVMAEWLKRDSVLVSTTGMFEEASWEELK